MTQPGTILLVGATGYLGAKVLDQLKATHPEGLHAMSRSGAPDGADLAVTWVRGDMMDPASLDAALAGIDTVVTTANGYMNGNIAIDFEGNANLIHAAKRAGVKRFVLLSIVACEQAPGVPHFHAKKVAEDLIHEVGLPHVVVRAPAFLDQSKDFFAEGTRSGRIMAMGDRTTRWSYTLTDDLAADLARAATHEGDEIVNRTIDVGWSDGPKNQSEIAEIIGEVTNRDLKVRTVPWAVFRLVKGPLKLFTETASDIVRMFLFFRRGTYVSDTSARDAIFGPSPTARDAVSRWARAKGLVA